MELELKLPEDLKKCIVYFDIDKEDETSLYIIKLGQKYAFLSKFRNSFVYEDDLWELRLLDEYGFDDDEMDYLDNEQVVWRLYSFVSKGNL